MLKTNTKRAKENIQAYILDNYNYNDFPCDRDFKQVANNIYNDFVSCILGTPSQSKANLKYYGNEFGAFTYYCSGLPSILDTCYYYNRSAVDDLGEILEETQEEKAKYTEDKAELKLTYLIYREIKGAIK